MATNIELKARVHDPAGLKTRVAAISDTAGELIRQEDIFFNSPHGRLKLRILTPDHGELIYYERPDNTGPKQSNYFISRTNEPATLTDVLSRTYGVRGVVRKERWLYWIGNTRIHLDQVEGLGSFLEFEVVLADGQSIQEGQEIAADLMDRLDIADSDLIDAAYIDLLERNAAG
jgi:predicted adenylyl cyclase CyaB